MEKGNEKAVQSESLPFRSDQTSASAPTPKLPQTQQNYRSLVQLTHIHSHSSSVTG